jgi:Fe2+ transport system protein FeoA
MLQMSGNRRGSPCRQADVRLTLIDLQRGEYGVLERLDLPEDQARRLMELGFIPGARITVGHSAPGGDPRVFQVDGSEVALRRETAARLQLRCENQSHGSEADS